MVYVYCVFQFFSDCNYVESNTAELCTFWFEGVLLVKS